MNRNFDVIVIGAGSVGVPATMNLAKSGKKVLCIDALSSPGQCNNKKAIGGVRATHSDFGKIKICQRSIDIFSTWHDVYGDDIGWMSNGYCFPAYSKKIESDLLLQLDKQRRCGLNISWIAPDEVQRLVPGIELRDLAGATFSKDDGSCSPLLACNAMYFKSVEMGATYRFNESVIDITFLNNVFCVTSNKDKYFSEFVINAAGNNAREISNKLGFDCPVVPDSHEAAITDPVQRFLGPMVVDLRQEKGSDNFYFYQNHEGQVIFCLTPKPLIYGVDNDATSDFLPLCTTRMLKVLPRLRSLKVRRQWRGQYPMTPDGMPIVGHFENNLANSTNGAIVSNQKFIQAVGMCGQGFMLGPGLGELLNRMIDDELTKDDAIVLNSFDPNRGFINSEAFK